MNEDMNDVIEDAINDSVTLEATEEVTSEEVVVDTPTEEVVSADESVVEDTTNPEQVASPGQKATDAVTKATEDDFAKKFGLQAQSVTGRENRIPYSRVKKIVEKNEKDTVARVTKELETKFQPQLTERDTKIQDYESRLTKVGEFEQIMENDPRTFLGMLSQLPAYKEFFDFVQQAMQQGQTTQTPAQEQPFLDQSGMPQPDQVLSDGSRFYSLEGLAKRDEWLARQIEAKAVKQAEERIAARYKPIEQAWQSQEHLARIAPVVEKQIAEARTWPNFEELEGEIVQLLKTDRNLSLEGAYMRAYQKNVVPKMVADRNKVRSEVLAEIKKKPSASGTPVAGIKPGPTAQTGPRSLEDIISASIQEAGLK